MGAVDDVAVVSSVAVVTAAVPAAAAEAAGTAGTATEVAVAFVGPAQLDLEATGIADSVWV